MVKPRAAKQKPIVLSSDSDDNAPPPPKRLKRGTLLSAPSGTQPTTSRASRAQTTRAVSPNSVPSTSQKSPAKPASKPITSFFRNASRAPSAQPPPLSSADKVTIPLDDFDDIFDSSDDDRPAQPQSALPIRKQKSSAVVGAVESDKATKGRQKFLLTASRAHSTPPPSQPARADPVDRRPWTDQFGPASLEELAVHKKKVADVQQWLTDVFSGTSRKRLLLLKGPAGSGKTTTVSLLSKELGIDMHEWKNPNNSMSTSDSFVSATVQFDDFVGRTGAFGSLAFDGHSQTPSQASSGTSNDRKKQLVLVEEFPNTFARASSAVQSFRSSVLKYLAANTQSASAFFAGQASSAQSITPIVMIISETLLSTNTAAADSFTAHRLLGPEILTHPGVSVIEFNPIAVTFMTKALDMMVVKEARKSGRKKTVGPQVIQRLAELGDIRSAASSLEFLCLRGDDADGWGAKVNFTKKKAPKDTPMTKMEQESLELVTQRESTLGIFHAVGRVVYNKRLPESPGVPVPQPPNWFPERRRPKASEVNLETLIDELGTDTQTFTAALHENYVLSCGGTDSEETMESIEGCIEALSDADLLSPDRFGADAGRRNLQGTSADNLRQDEMCFQTSVRGLLYNLPNPVKRIAPPPGIMGIKAKGQGAPPAGPRGNAFVMYYPASLRLWRQQEETSDLLELWISRAQRGDLLAPDTGISKPPATPGGVDTWRRTQFSQPLPPPPNPTATHPRTPDTTTAPTLLGSGASARSEMLLERLPYLTTILRGNKARAPSAATTATLRAIQKITSFHGSATASGGDGDGDGEDDLEQAPGAEGEQWATDKPGEGEPRRKRVRIEAKTKTEEAAVAEMGGGLGEGASLVLSDDDIED
jgi:cell cycle checkpoint protein